MKQAMVALLVFVFVVAPAKGADLAAAPSEELLRVYAQLRALQGSDQYAVTDNAVFKRDAATFTFSEGRLSFAAPVAGRVVAAVFIGQGTFKLDPPTAVDRHQIERFAKDVKLEDTFREAMFFFTDTTWDELQKIAKVQSGGDASAATKLLDSTQKRYEEELNEWWESYRKGGFPMRNLAARLLADLSDPSSRGMFLADIKSDHHDDLLFHISWNRDQVIHSSIGSDEEVTLMHWKRGEYSEWWSGFHMADEYEKNPHPEHRHLLAHCRDEHIEAEVSKSNHISATAEMEFEVPGGAARVLPLNLDGVLRISSVTDEAGRKVNFIQEDRKLDSDPWVILPEAAAPGKAYKMKIAYEEDSTQYSRIIHQAGPGLYYVGSRESWYPSFGAFDDRTNFKLRFRSPKKFKFVATGHSLSSEKAGDYVETVWESEMPYSVVGFNYGDFVEKAQSDDQLTITAYAGREVPDELFGLKNSFIGGGIDTSRMVGQTAAISYAAFKLFEEYFGPLPFKTISVTEQPVTFYGQSWPTLIYLPYGSLLDTTTRHFIGLGGSAETREFFDTVSIHEMSHQWWGHMVGWKTYHDQWLSEGFADFSAGLYVQATKPKEFKNYWDLKRKWLLNNNRAGHHPNDVGPLWLSYQTNSYLEGGGGGAVANSRFLIYDKAAYVLEMLRTVMTNPRAQDADAAFKAMMHDFVKTYAGKNASTEDFRHVVERHVGQHMDWFFNE